MLQLEPTAQTVGDHRLRGEGINFGGKAGAKGDGI
jgi:hypothetical protein